MSEQSLGQRVLNALGIRPQPAPSGPEPGVYHYECLEKEWPTRFHLRVDPDGAGLLMANAAQAAMLSPSGVQMAQGILEGLADEEIGLKVREDFPGASLEQIAADLLAVRELITQLSQPGDNYPVSNLDDPYAFGRARAMAAPLRADVVPGEVDTSVGILRKLWDIGIPQATFLAQPQTNHDGLVRMVEAAEDLGMIAGIRSVAGWLSEETFHRAAMAGLDHLTLVYVSASASEHDNLIGGGDHERVLAFFEQAEALELCRVAQVPLIQSNIDELEQIVSGLQAQNVTNLSFFALACPDDDQSAQQVGALAAASLPQVATIITEASEQANVRLLWEPPVRFDSTKSLAEQVMAGPRAAGDVAIRIEQDGSVFAARGPRICAGNILSEAWDDIWGSECFTRYRERLAQPTRCSDCPGLAICAADCPKDSRGWSDDVQRGESE